MGRGDDDTFDAILDHCLLQAGLWLHCIWQSIKRRLRQKDKWTTSITLDCDRHYELSAPAVSSLSIEAKQAPLQEIRLNLLMHYYLETGASIDNLAHHALHKYDTRDLYAPKPNGRGGMTRPATPSTGLKVEAAVTCAEINVELVCPLGTPSFPPETHGYDPMRYNLVEGVSKCIIPRQETKAKFKEYIETQGSHGDVYTDDS